MDKAKKVEKLIKQLSHTDDFKRWMAASELVEMEDKRAIQPLVKALFDSDGMVRYCTAKALRKLNDSSCVPDLIKALTDTKEDTRIAALEGLAQLADENAVPHIIKTMERDTDMSVKRTAAKALLQLSPKDKQILPYLLGLLKHDDDKMRFTVVSTFKDNLDDAAEPFLIEALNDTNWGVRYLAAEGLCLLRNDRGISYLISALSDDQPGYRYHAAFALGHSGNPKAIPHLVRNLTDTVPAVRYSAAHALGMIGDKGVLSHLVTALADPDGGVRGAAAYALGRIAEKSAVPHLVRALRDSEKEVRAKAAAALGELGDKVVVDHMLSTSHHLLAMSAFTERDQGKMKEMFGTLSDPAETVRAAVARALGKLAVKDTLSKLVHVLKYDLEASVRESAAIALGEMGDTQGVPPLIDALVNRNKRVRAAASEALLKLNYGSANLNVLLVDKDHLSEALDDEDYHVSVAAAKVLGNMGDKAATKQLLKRLSDNDIEVRIAAAEALGKLGDRTAACHLAKVARDNEEASYAADTALQQLGVILPAALELRVLTKKQFNLGEFALCSMELSNRGPGPAFEIRLTFFGEAVGTPIRIEPIVWLGPLENVALQVSISPKSAGSDVPVDWELIYGDVNGPEQKLHGTLYLPVGSNTTKPPSQTPVNIGTIVHGNLGGDVVDINMNKGNTK